MILYQLKSPTAIALKNIKLLKQLHNYNENALISINEIYEIMLNYMFYSSSY